MSSPSDSEEEWNPFEVLGLPVALNLSPQDIQRAYDEAAKRAHPDAQGSDLDADFSQVERARQSLERKSLRLTTWMRLHEVKLEKGGQLGAALMDWFSEITDLSQKIKRFCEAKKGQTGALAQALNSRQAMHLDEACAGRVRLLSDRLEATFHQAIAMTEGETEQIDQARLNDARVEMVFLEKWISELQKSQRDLLPFMS